MGHNPSARVSSGVFGLNEILRGGLVSGQSYPVRGDWGTGKTILGTNYLTAGAEADETVLHANLEESDDGIRDDATTLTVWLEEGRKTVDVSGELTLPVETPTSGTVRIHTEHSRRLRTGRSR